MIDYTESYRFNNEAIILLCSTLSFSVRLISVKKNVFFISFVAMNQCQITCNNIFLNKVIIIFTCGCALALRYCLQKSFFITFFYGYAFTFACIFIFSYASISLFCLRCSFISCIFSYRNLLIFPIIKSYKSKISS